MAQLDLAEEALSIYRDAGNSGDDFESTIDLIADLLLLTHQRGEDGESALRSAEQHFEEEKEGDDDDGGDDED
jgi:hypothetical protein